MKFSVGILDSLFGKKVTLEVPDENGNIIKREVSEKWLEQMQVEGKISRIHKPTVRVHMMDPLTGPQIIYWTVGEDVSQEQVNKYKDEVGDIYALTAYEAGKPTVMILSKQYWKDALTKMGIEV